MSFESYNVSVCVPAEKLNELVHMLSQCNLTASFTPSRLPAPSAPSPSVYAPSTPVPQISSAATACTSSMVAPMVIADAGTAWPQSLYEKIPDLNVKTLGNLSVIKKFSGVGALPVVSFIARHYGMSVASLCQLYGVDAEKARAIEADCLNPPRQVKGELKDEMHKIMIECVKARGNLPGRA